MNNILLKKILNDCIVFFLISLFASSLIIWVFQSVNYLDIILEDGRDYIVYLKFSFLNFPKIISKILPFIYFFSFFYVFVKYELNNEMLILWFHGIDKKKVFNFFLKISFIVVLIQIALISFIVPKTLNYAKSFIRFSEVNYLENFIKVRKFNDTVKNITFYADKKDDYGNYSNIYIKQGNDSENYKITYAKRGVTTKKQGRSFLELYDGETANINGGKISSFKFDKFDLLLSDFESNTSTYIKTQEMPTSKLMACYLNLNNLIMFELNYRNKKIENCSKKNSVNIIKELNKRLIQPFYIIVLSLIFLFLILKSKENINYFKFRLTIFTLGVLTIVLSEVVSRFIQQTILESLHVIAIPFFIMITLYIYFFHKFNFNYKN